MEPTITTWLRLWQLSPELVLLVTGFLILGLDLIHPQQAEKRWLPYVALAGLAGSLIATVTLWHNPAVTYGYVFQVLTLEPFSVVIKLLAVVATAIIVLLSDDFIRAQVKHPAFFYALLLFAALAICLLGAAIDLVMIFLAFDFLSLISYILTGYLREDRKGGEAALKYLLYGAALSAVMLYGLSWLYGMTGYAAIVTGMASQLQGSMFVGYTNLIVLGGVLANPAANLEPLRPLLLPAVICVLAGFSFKVAAVPFHQWAPDAYEGAPTPVTAFLSVAPKIAGFAVIIRFMLIAFPATHFMNADWQRLWIALSALTMTVGNLVALWQTNVKRLLAYSSIAQAGYVLIGVAAMSEKGMTAVLLYVTAYMLTNLGAFAVVTLVGNQTHSYELGDFAGLNKRAPAAALVLILCLISLAGIPPTAGFMGKLWLFSAALENEYSLLWLAVLGVLNSVLSLAYYWKIIRAAYLAPSTNEEPIRLSPLMGTALTLTGVGVLVLGIFPNWFLPTLEQGAQFWFRIFSGG